MTASDDQKRDQQPDDLDLDPQTVSDLDVDEGDAEEVQGGCTGTIWTQNTCCLGCHPK